VAEHKCTPAILAGRLRKAREFQQAADILATTAAAGELSDAYVTLCVHAGIAAADVICCRRLNVHHKGESHDDAVRLLSRIDRQLGGDLAVLLRRKTASGYGATSSSAADRKQARRAMERLVDAAEAASSAGPRDLPERVRR